MTIENSDDEKIAETLIASVVSDTERIETLERENARLRKWIEELDVLAENNGERREWLGSEIGWLYPGCAAYYARPRREDILANVPSHLPRTVGATDAGSEATKHPA